MTLIKELLPKIRLIKFFALVNLYNLISGANVPSKATPVDAQVKQRQQNQRKLSGVVLTGIMIKCTTSCICNQ
jgi:hypothetical protein